MSPFRIPRISLVALFLVAPLAPLLAQVNQFVGSASPLSYSWPGTNWSLGSYSAGTANAITFSDALTHQINFDLGGSVTINEIALDNTGGGTVNLAFTNNPAAALLVGSLNVGHNGSASVTQSGGTVSGGINIGGWSSPDPVWGGSPSGSNARGTYTLSGGTLSETQDINVGSGMGGIGVFNQSGGTVTLNNGLFLAWGNGSTGTYNLSGGKISPASTDLDIYVGAGGNGTFNQTGGTVSGWNGTSGASGSRIILGGGSGSNGSYNLSGGTIDNYVNEVHVGYLGGNGTFSQTGGTQNAANIYVGDDAGSTGSYLLQTGNTEFSVAHLYIGRNGNGTFTQDGADASLSSLTVGGGSGSGSYTMRNGSTLSATTETVGSDINEGAFYQYGGTNTISTSLTVGAAGSYYSSGEIFLFAGATFTNNGALTLAGSVITGNNNGSTFTNNGIISGHGDIGGTYNVKFTNYGTINPDGGPIKISANTDSSNFGTINLSTGNGLTISSNTLTNYGAIHLGGGTLGGTGNLTNVGMIDGSGAISFGSDKFDNAAGGTLSVTSGLTRVANASTNEGLVNLGSASAILSLGGVMINSGTIQGLGSITGTELYNGGTLEAIGGTLAFGGTLDNTIGLIRASSGNKVLVSTGLGVNGGAISLTGGTFDNNGHSLNNTGQITGYGTISTGGLTNAGTFTLTGALSTVNGAVTNNATKTIQISYNPAIFTGQVTNNGTVKITGTTATFGGGFVNNGAYISDPATTHFSNLTINSSGTLVGGAGDVFIIDSGYLHNLSTNNTGFDISQAKLSFAAGSLSMTWSAANLGATAAGYTNNFAIGDLDLQTGAAVSVGPSFTNNAVYVEALTLGGGLGQLSSLTSSINIYYDPNNALNAYLLGGTYALTGGGFLEPVTAVPEPTTAALGLGLVGLLCAWRRRRAAL